MTKIKISAVAFMATAALIISYQVSNSKILFPPYGNNGDPNSIPGTQTCAQCHSGNSLKSANGNVAITFRELSAADSVIIDSFKYRPGTVYSVTFKPQFTAARYGFQLSALNTSNQNAGALAVVNSTNTWIGTGNVSKYISHHNASSNNAWNFNWTAPATDIGDVTFYYTMVQANASTTESGDTVYKGNTVITADTSVVNGIKAEPLKELAVYPNPATNYVNVSFQNQSNGYLAINLYALNGALQKQLLQENNTSPYFNRNLLLNDVPPGIYLLNLKAAGKESTLKLVVQ